MAKHSTKKERDDKRFLFIYKWELVSPAYKALTGDEVRVYQDMRIRYNGRNNGRIVYPSRQAGKVIHKSHVTGGKRIARLIELGFLKVRQPSTFGQKRLATEYELTAIGRAKAAKSNKLPSGTNEFMHWTAKKIADHDARKSIEEQQTQKTRCKATNIIHLRADP